MSSREPLPYWLAGTERCPVCAGTYLLEMECRCVACDAGICVECVMRVHYAGDPFCPECFDPEETG